MGNYDAAYTLSTHDPSYSSYNYSYPDGHLRLYINAHKHSYPDSHIQLYVDAHKYGHCNGHTVLYVTHAHGHSYCYLYADSNTNRHHHCYCDSDRNVYPNTDRYCDFNTDRYADINSNSDCDPHTEAYTYTPIQPVTASASYSAASPLGTALRICETKCVQRLGFSRTQARDL